jgi:mannose-6-phosphate isomerase-like protein (cupin superfamily)
MRQNLAWSTQSVARLKVSESGWGVAHRFAAAIGKGRQSVPQQFALRIGALGIGRVGSGRLSHVNKITLVSGRRESMPRKPVRPKSSQPESAQAISVQPVPVQSRRVCRENAEHYRWGTDCDGWHLVKDERLSVIEELMPPGAAEARHHHLCAQQFFYILSGEILIEVEGQTTLVPAGSGIRVPPGVRHQVRNPSSGPARFLVISQPPSHADRINE